MSNKTALANHVQLPEAELSFHPVHQDSRDIHPLRGLMRYGPYSEGFFQGPVRVATLAPHKQSNSLNLLMRDLKTRVKATTRPEYIRDWVGFKALFKADLVPAAQECRIELPDGLDGELRASEKPHMRLVEVLEGHIKQMAQRRYDFDVLLLLVPKSWDAFCRNFDENFDLHDQLKAICAIERIPMQIIKETGAIAFKDRASVMWRMGVAIYAKAGGIPWKLADTDTDTAYIGLSYAVKLNSDGETQFVTCCSQVFDNDGSGLEFVAYSTDEVEFERRNPYLSRTEMFRIMTRSLDLYRRRHAGRIPKKIVVHKTTEFKPNEVDGCMDAFHLCESVDLIRIVQSVGWRGMVIENKESKGARFPVERGTLLNIGHREALLWIHGNVKGIDGNKPYFQGKRGTPQPLRLFRDAGHGSWDQTAAATLALSKMDWNNDALYGQLPVTLAYSKVLANVIKRMPNLGSAPYEYRYFM